MSAKSYIDAALRDCLPPDVPPSYRSIDRAAFQGSGKSRRAVGSLVMFDGLPAEVEVWQSGGCTAHRFTAMPGWGMLILRRLEHPYRRGAERDHDWEVHHKGYTVGRIMLTQGRSDSPPDWRWVIHVHSWPPGEKPVRDGREATREQAMVAFRAAFERLMAHIGEQGWLQHVRHMDELEARDRWAAEQKARRAGLR